MRFIMVRTTKRLNVAEATASDAGITYKHEQRYGNDDEGSHSQASC
jgi:hypothetical protein